MSMDLDRNQEELDTRDIREVLINNANYRFAISRVKSASAYRIFLFIVLGHDLYRFLLKKEVLFEYDSLNHLAEKLSDYYSYPLVKNKSSIKTALEYLDDTALIMSNSQQPTAEELKECELNNSKYLFLYINVEDLLRWRPAKCEEEKLDIEMSKRVDEWRARSFVRSDKRRTLFFDNYLQPILLYVNSRLVSASISLLGNQIMMYLILQLEEEHFEGCYEAREVKFIYDTYDGFANALMPFIGCYDIPNSTISDNLDALHNTYLIDVSLTSPEEDKDCESFGNSRSCLIIKFYFDEENQLILSNEISEE